MELYARRTAHRPVDCIGGRPEVAIRNYFYVGTVEERIYTGIAGDVDWFEDIVGPAQPVLGQVEDVIEHIAMQMPNADRDHAVMEEIAKIRAAIEEGEACAVSMADVGRAPDTAEMRELRPAIDSAGLEGGTDVGTARRGRISSAPIDPGAYLVESAGSKVAVTFRRPLLEAHPGELRLLTYATAEMERIMADVQSRDGEAFEWRC